jgi:glucuronosyltransferase
MFNLTNLQQFKSFVDEAKEGLIIFTLGSIVPVSSMPKETLQAFMGAFAKIPQKVIWKWEDEIPVDLPSNIMMTKWLPQQDLLGIF